MASVAASLDKLATCNILVAGDVMLDRYWFGNVDRISPEAPVPVVTVDQRLSEERLGGAGNVACNITSLGARCALLSVVGDDEAGRQVSGIAARTGIEDQLVIDRGGQTTIKLRAISRNQQLLRADFESAPGAAALEAARSKFADLLARDSLQAVVLSDYGKGGLDDSEKLIALAAQKNVPVLVDPKGADFARYRGAAMVTPNLAEFEQVAGAVADDDDMRRKANALMRQHRLSKLLVTLSDRGMVLFSSSPEGEVIRRPARAKEVYDVSGAGDTVIAVMALALAAALDDRDALALANAAAGVVVSKVGTATAGIDELKSALSQDDGGGERRCS